MADSTAPGKTRIEIRDQGSDPGAAARIGLTRDEADGYLLAAIAAGSHAFVDLADRVDAEEPSADIVQAAGALAVHVRTLAEARNLLLFDDGTEG